ncbi:hypothetical protein GCM10022267_47830 [Lentzea roselyniae]|uniref:Uncharacterized protein n=1 Tax=Lentzea roselyniae TaxID=531940 RepID=A0ABP7BDZ7_9PSEU
MKKEGPSGGRPLHPPPTPATIYIGDESRSLQRSTLGWVLGVLAERVSDEADAAALKEAADWGGWQMAVIDGNNYRDPVAIAQ